MKFNYMLGILLSMFVFPSFAFGMTDAESINFLVSEARKIDGNVHPIELDKIFKKYCSDLRRVYLNVDGIEEAEDWVDELWRIYAKKSFSEVALPLMTDAQAARSTLIEFTGISALRTVEKGLPKPLSGISSSDLKWVDWKKKIETLVSERYAFTASNNFKSRPLTVTVSYVVTPESEVKDVRIRKKSAYKMFDNIVGSSIQSLSKNEILHFPVPEDFDVSCVSTFNHFAAIGDFSGARDRGNPIREDVEHKVVPRGKD